jgi:hypothetical protein
LLLKHGHGARKGVKKGRTYLLLGIFQALYPACEQFNLEAVNVLWPTTGRERQLAKTYGEFWSSANALLLSMYIESKQLANTRQADPTCSLPIKHQRYLALQTRKITLNQTGTLILPQRCTPVRKLSIFHRNFSPPMILSVLILQKSIELIQIGVTRLAGVKHTLRRPVVRIVLDELENIL